MHNNYFLQVQTLINQKAIGSPTQEKSHPARKESNLSSQESSVSAQEKKHTVETVCLTCGELFTAERSTRKFCSGKCKAAYYRKKSKEDII